MHRPVAFSQTADRGQLSYLDIHEKAPIGPPITIDTWDYIDVTSKSDDYVILEGWVSSYNINTFKGRVYLSAYGRPIPFILADDIRSARKIAMITTSLNANARERLGDDGRRFIQAYTFTSSTGKIKSILIVDVMSSEP